MSKRLISGLMSRIFQDWKISFVRVTLLHSWIAVMLPSKQNSWSVLSKIRAISLTSFSCRDAKTYQLKILQITTWISRIYLQSHCFDYCNFGTWFLRYRKLQLQFHQNIPWFEFENNLRCFRNTPSHWSFSSIKRWKFISAINESIAYFSLIDEYFID